MLNMTNMLGIFTVINLKKSPHFYKKILVSKKITKPIENKSVFCEFCLFQRSLGEALSGQFYFSSTSEQINFKSYVLIALVEVDETIKHRIILYIAYTFTSELK